MVLKIGLEMSLDNSNNKDKDNRFIHTLKKIIWACFITS